MNNQAFLRDKQCFLLQILVQSKEKIKGDARMTVREYYADLPSVETSRLLLRKVTLDDTADLFEYGRTEEVTRHVTWSPYERLEDARNFITHIIAYYETGQVAPWAIEEKASGKMIGTIGFGAWKERHYTAEIAYALSHNFWGKGFMPEAVRAAFRVGFKQLDLVRIEAQCLPENENSARVMEKVGMSHEGTLRKRMYVKGKSRDLDMYSILREEFFMSI